MAAVALRLCLALALLLRCVSPVAIPQRDGLDATTNDQLDYLNDLPRPPTTPKKKAPKFMLDYFNAVSISDGIQKSQREILEGNIVRSFEDRGRAGENFHFFNLSSIGTDEKMIKAELRWFRNKRKLDRGKSHGSHVYKVDLYEVLDGRVKPWRGNLLSSRLVPLHTQGWEIFNVTQMVTKWIDNSEENNGILVVTTFPSGGWMESMLYSLKQNVQVTNVNNYLVIFSNGGMTGASNQSQLGQTHLLSASSELRHQHSRRPRAAPRSARYGQQQPCQRVPLFVNFEEIGWSGWIISPRGYNAYHCRGSCPFPLGGHLKATNHATVRSIMHALKVSGDEASPPCCVPDKLQSMSLLYFDDEENVVLKQYDDMMAVSCGCR
ncbi:bone morphogenetic protein 2-B [Pholidichthys leucotaenia]